jgi:hypothetical protein
MSAAVPYAQPSTADDLEDLYEEVWAVFSEDSPPPSAETDNTHSVYSARLDTSRPRIDSTDVCMYPITASVCPYYNRVLW